jgi:hypothetical protein
VIPAGTAPIRAALLPSGEKRFSHLLRPRGTPRKEIARARVVAGLATRSRRHPRRGVKDHPLRPLARLTAALAFAVPVSTQAASLTRGPFLQQTTPTSTLVVAKTDVSASVRAVAQLPGGATVEASSSGTHHVLRLEGLPVASEVAYQVLVDGVEKSSGLVRTPGRPGTAEGRKAVIGVIGDHGTADPVAVANGERLRERGVSAVFTTGDNAYPDGATGDWDPRMFRPFAPMLRSTTLWPVPGDHEYRSPGGQPYRDAHELPEGPQGERYYSFDWGDLHVVALDSNCIVPLVAAEAGCTTASMTTWLRADLAASDAPWKIALIHRPAVATGKYGVYPQIPAALVPIFQEFGVDLVFQGHNHLYERTWPTRDGVPTQQHYDRPTAPVYVTSGGGGGWLYDFALPPAPWTAYRIKDHQHNVLTLDGGTLKVDSVNEDGTLHDTFTIVKDIPPLPDAGDASPPPGGPQLPVPPPGTPPESPTEAGTSGSGCASSGSGGMLSVAALAVAAAALWRRRAFAPVPVPARRVRRAARAGRSYRA